MALPKMTEYTQPISGLAPQGGPEVNLQGVFQQCFDEIMNAVNDLADALMGVVDGESGADGIGATLIEGLGDENTKTVQLIVEALKLYIDAHKNRSDNPHNVTPEQLNVYTKDDINPYLRGGDTVIKVEVFTIVNSNLGDGTFSYTDKNGITIIGMLGISGQQLFMLQEGSYELGLNRIDAVVNDTLQRSVSSGGLEEISTSIVALTQPEGNGAEITIKYFEKIGIIGTGLIVMGEANPGAGYFWYKVVA